MQLFYFCTSVSSLGESASSSKTYSWRNLTNASDLILIFGDNNATLFLFLLNPFCGSFCQYQLQFCIFEVGAEAHCAAAGHLFFFCWLQQYRKDALKIVKFSPLQEWPESPILSWNISKILQLNEEAHTWVNSWKNVFLTQILLIGGRFCSSMNQQVHWTQCQHAI